MRSPIKSLIKKLNPPLEVGFEVFQGGGWKHQVFTNNCAHLPAIVVGSSDFLMTGTQKDIVKWLVQFDRPVRCFDGFGQYVWVVLRGVQAKVSDEILKAYGGALGAPGGIPSLISTGLSAFSGCEALITLNELATNPSEINLDAMSLVGSKVHVRLTSAQGCHSNHGQAKNSVIKLQSGLSSKYFGGALARLSW